MIVEEPLLVVAGERVSEAPPLRPPEPLLERSGLGILPFFFSLVLSRSESASEVVESFLSSSFSFDDSVSLGMAGLEEVASFSPPRGLHSDLGEMSSSRVDGLEVC